MIRLNLAAEPQWYDLLPGVRFRLRPPSATILASARSAPAVQELVAQDAPESVLSVALAKEVAVLALIEWEGIGDDDGVALEPSPEVIDAALEIYPLFEAFQVKYMAPGLLKEQEKNGSAPSPSGTSAAATPTAKGARKPAKAAPTASTSQKRSRAPRSGI